MEIPLKEAYRIFKRKGVDYIYHANSVITSCQFLRNGALLSRGTIERSSLYQTAQNSDESDKKLGIWFDIFADSIDIHDHINRANVYGPVLFVLDVKIIARSYTGKIWITKLNPKYWKGKTHDQRWFTSAEDLEDNFVKGWFDQMVVFRHCGGELPINKCLDKIVLDDPRLIWKPRKTSYFSMAYGALKLAMTEGGIRATIEKRKCGRRCKCRTQYSYNRKRYKVMFLPWIQTNV